MEKEIEIALQNAVEKSNNWIYVETGLWFDKMKSTNHICNPLLTSLLSLKSFLSFWTHNPIT
jgi:hypothetical protein